MRYVDKSYYDNTFKGPEIPEDFDLFATIAEELADIIATQPIDMDKLTDEQKDYLKRAICYEIMYLHAQGGMEAVNGFTESDIESESLGDYRISRGGSSGSSTKVKTVNGIPVHSMLLALLKKAGLYSVWVYKGTVLDNGI